MISLKLIILKFFILIKLINSLPSEFNVIGPFPIGEREEGLDSLKAYGGIFEIPIGDDTMYPSELGTNGVVGWEKVQSTSGGYLSIDWSDIVDWSFLQQTWGWSIWLWYGYAIGSFNVENSGSYIINCSGTRQYFIQSTTTTNTNNQIFEFSGDFYGYGTGQQLIHLNQSTTYNLIVRMQSSVRLSQSPNSQFSCSLTPIQNNQYITVLNSETLISDLINGELATPFATITIFNNGIYSNDNNDKNNNIIDLINVTVNNNTQSIIDVKLLNNSNLNILAGQKMSLPLEITIGSQINCPFNLTLNIESNGEIIGETVIEFNCTEWGNPYLYTFLDYDNTVQYAIAIPPTESCSDSEGETICGVMLATHGAGVEASSPFWMNAIPPQQSLWIILPTGRRSWGYDWESSSRLNVMSSIDYLVNNLPGVPNQLKSQYQVNGEKILFVGHSCGGHGCVSLLSRFGDMAIGGMCAAGFVKLQFYVFYNTRPGFSYIDPSLQGLLMASIAENDNDLYTSNIVGIPLMVRYGENDTNVNPWHSRRIARMVDEQSNQLSSVTISEVPNSGHWFDGILNDQYVLNWYNQLTESSLFSQPPIPKVITVTSHNPSSSGSRANIKILQTINPSRVAKIQIVQINNEQGELVWILSTQNVRRFGFQSTPIRTQGLPISVTIDGQPFTTEFLPTTHFARLDKWLPDWNTTTDTTWTQTERSPLTSGPIRQIFEKPFTIIYGTNSTNIDLFQWGSVFISNFYNTYGRGSPNILADIDFVEPEICSSNDNYILLGNSFQNLVTSKYQSLLPVVFNWDNSFSVGPSSPYSYPGTGILFLAPNPCGQGLILVVAGYDDQGFNNALHSIPQRSGVLVPDFMVVGNDIWKGAGGIISTGFWDPNWFVSLDSSYFGFTPF
ncbi:hypothetical protein DDB_G0283989 [Dictyostelium discoideum AX4]|uniref:Peptidase S9 prolyl oligopeptidase catalytic domain-containing protein n=1 Tax=Dictyostelium discoideum TaxID=44689 RepID=Q54QE3_DICDI|nr:hypothetical protein DDB_G0283989 [Dictyostelium discoideum AX4]EAL65482.1 hypothetical protein DDB_G0283989 [Dictyostelium discoideum AX4]|eukprot:XP_638801.1 hypothetical protein DDB_G0283989 [Dictyostelium discoideum AX4]